MALAEDLAASTAEDPGERRLLMMWEDSGTLFNNIVDCDDKENGKNSFCIDGSNKDCQQNHWMY